MQNKPKFTILSLKLIEKEITSLQHPLVKTLVRIRKDKRVREEENLVLISGKTQIEESAQRQGLTMLFLAKGIDIPNNWKADVLYWTTKEIIKKITGLVEPELIAATIPLPEKKSLENKQWILALDGLTDPGNLGTLLRTALSLGWEGGFLLPGCVDPFNEKAIRSAKGASFRLPICFGEGEQLLLLAKKNNLLIWTADMEGTPLRQIQRTFPNQNGSILILGNETHGISPLFKQHSQKVMIPMIGDMESLNVASAGAILLHGLKAHG